MEITELVRVYFLGYGGRMDKDIKATKAYLHKLAIMYHFVILAFKFGR